MPPAVRIAVQHREEGEHADEYIRDIIDKTRRRVDQRGGELRAVAALIKLGVDSAEGFDRVRLIRKQLDGMKRADVFLRKAVQLRRACRPARGSAGCRSA